LTGDLEYIKRIGRDIFLQNVQEGQHLNHALVIDRDGKIRGSFDVLDSAKTMELKKLVRQLLDEKPSTAVPPTETNEQAAAS
jgi:protein SCO1/2